MLYDTLGMDYLERNIKGRGLFGDLLPTVAEIRNLDMSALNKLAEEYNEVIEKLNNPNISSDEYLVLSAQKEYLEKDIDVIETDLRGYYDTLKEYTKDFDFVENAAPGSADEAMNSYITLTKQIEGIFTRVGQIREKHSPVDE